MRLRWILFLFAVATLGLSGFAGWFFFGGPEDDPTRRKMEAHVGAIEAKMPEAEAGSARAQYELARLYRNGEQEQNPSQSHGRSFNRRRDKSGVLIGTNSKMGGRYWALLWSFMSTRWRPGLGSGRS